jgi:hypothetical protein
VFCKARVAKNLIQGLKQGFHHSCILVFYLVEFSMQLYAFVGVLVGVKKN